MDVLVGIDIGGSHVGIGVVEKIGLKLLDSISIPLDNSVEPDEMVERVSKGALSLLDAISGPYSLISVGIGCPGQSKDGVLIAASNLPKFKNFPLAKKIGELLNCSYCLLLNDADAAIACEVWAPINKEKYRGVKNAALITLGTGVGLGLVVNERLYQGSRSLIEGGHMIVGQVPSKNLSSIRQHKLDSIAYSHPRLCGCGQVNCAEVFASASNTALRMAERDLKSSSLEALSSKSSEMGSKEVFRRASQGDEDAKDVLQETYDAIAMMCINITRVLDPDVIIIGGGMAHAGETLLNGIKESYYQYTWSVLPSDMRFELCSRCDDVGILGAAFAAYKSKQHIPLTLDTTKSTIVKSTIKSIGISSLFTLALGGAFYYTSWKTSRCKFANYLPLWLVSCQLFVNYLMGRDVLELEEKDNE